MERDQSPPEQKREPRSRFVCYITEDLIKKVTGKDNLKDVTVLNLKRDSNEKIRKIENLDGLVNLQRLNLAFNCITKIEHLNTLTNLRELSLADNAISKLENLDCLVNLELLSVAGNQIERIPKSIAKLRRLQVLRLERNRLSELRDIEHLKPLAHLTTLSVQANPIASLPHFLHYAVFHLQTLETLNGDTITVDDHRLAAERFSREEANALERDLAVARDTIRTLTVQLAERDDALAKAQHAAAALQADVDKLTAANRKVEEELETKTRLLDKKTKELTKTCELLYDTQRQLDFLKIDQSFAGEWDGAGGWMAWKTPQPIAIQPSGPVNDAVEQLPLKQSPVDMHRDRIQQLQEKLVALESQLSSMQVQCKTFSEEYQRLVTTLAEPSDTGAPEEIIAGEKKVSAILTALLDIRRNGNGWGLGQLQMVLSDKLQQAERLRPFLEALDEDVQRTQSLLSERKRQLDEHRKYCAHVETEHNGPAGDITVVREARREGQRLENEVIALSQRLRNGKQYVAEVCEELKEAARLIQQLEEAYSDETAAQSSAGDEAQDDEYAATEEEYRMQLRGYVEMLAMLYEAYEKECHEAKHTESRMAEVEGQMKELREAIVSVEEGIQTTQAEISQLKRHEPPEADQRPAVDMLTITPSRLNEGHQEKAPLAGADGAETSALIASLRGELQVLSTTVETQKQIIDSLTKREHEQRQKLLHLEAEVLVKQQAEELARKVSRPSTVEQAVDARVVDVAHMMEELAVQRERIRQLTDDKEALIRRIAAAEAEVKSLSPDMPQLLAPTMAAEPVVIPAGATPDEQVRSLQRQVTFLRTMLTARQQRLKSEESMQVNAAELRKQISVLNTTVDQQMGEIRALRQKLSEALEHKHAEESNSLTAARVKDHEEELQVLLQRIEDAKREQQELAETAANEQQSVMLAREQLQAVKAEIRDEHRRLVELQEECNQAEHTLQQLHADLQSATDDHAAMQERLQRLEQCILEKQQEIDILDQKIQQAREAALLFERANTQLETAQHDLTIQRAQQDVLKSELESRTKQLEDVSLKLETTRNQLCENESQLQLQLRIIEDAKRSAALHREQAEQMAQDLAERQDALNQVNSEIAAKEAKLSDRLVEYRNLLEQTRMLQEELRKTQQDTADEKETLRLTCELVQQAKSELQSTYVQLAEMRDRYAQLQSELRRVEEAIAAKSTELEHLQTRFAEEQQPASLAVQDPVQHVLQNELSVVRQKLKSEQLLHHTNIRNLQRVHTAKEKRLLSRLEALTEEAAKREGEWKLQLDIFRAQLAALQTTTSAVPVELSELASISHEISKQIETLQRSRKELLTITDLSHAVEEREAKISFLISELQQLRRDYELQLQRSENDQQTITELLQQLCLIQRETQPRTSSVK